MAATRLDLIGRTVDILMPLKRAVSLLTLAAFLFYSIVIDISWAVGTPSALPGGGDEASYGTGGIDKKEVNPDTFSLPEYLGSVKYSYKAPGSVRTVIHIQDAHCNYAAQHKVKDILEHLDKKYSVDIINLEGGAKEYDLSIFARLGNGIAREKTADYFVKEGLVSGAEYFAINDPDKATLWGIEDAKLYIENLNIYRKSLQYKEEVDRHLKAIGHILNNLKAKIYSLELLDLDRRYSQYKSGKIEFKDYLSYLIDTAKSRSIDIRSYTNIFLLKTALEEESKIDFEKANNQRDELIDILQKKLSKKSVEELIVKTVEYKREKISGRDFYQYLSKKSGLVGVEIKNFPDLQRYIIYISMYGAIDKSRIIDEMDALESRLKESMYRTDEERELGRLSKNLSIAENIFNISLTKEDYKYYADNKAGFAVSGYMKFIEALAPKHNITARPDKNIADLDRYREDMSKFYEYSFRRDEAFRGNMKFGRNNSAVIVTGGFHTESLCDIFRKEGISYVSIMPSFRNDDGYDCPYFRLLAGNECAFLKELRPIFAPGSAIQIPSMLSEAIASEVWGKANIDSFRAAAIIRRYMDEGTKVEIILDDGRVMTFGEGEKKVTLTTRGLLDAVHQADIDGEMERLPESAFEDIEGIDNMLKEVTAFLASLGANEDVLKNVDGLKGTNEDGKALVRLVRGVTFRGHAGGKGIRMSADLKDKEDDLKALKGVLAHEVIAVLYGDHFLAEKVEEMFLGKMEKSDVLARVPPLEKPIWEMAAGDRLDIDRDYARDYYEEIGFRPDGATAAVDIKDIKQYRKWQQEGVEVKIRAVSWSKNIDCTGKIRLITGIEEGSPVIWLEGNVFGIFLKDIVEVAIPGGQELAAKDQTSIIPAKPSALTPKSDLIAYVDVVMLPRVGKQDVQRLREYVHPIAISGLPNGGVVLADTSSITYGAGIYMPDGSFKPLLDEDGQPLTQEIVKMMTTDDIGNIYVATAMSKKTGKGRIIGYSQDGTILGSYDVSYGEREGNYGINIQGMVVFENKLYYTIAGFGQFRALDLISGEEKVYGGPETVGPFLSTRSMGLSLDRQNRTVFIVDSGYKQIVAGGMTLGDTPMRIRKFLIDTEEYGEPQDMPGMFSTGGVSIADGGIVYISDRDRNIIHVYSISDGYQGYVRTLRPATSLNIDDDGSLMIGRSGGFDIISQEALFKLIVRVANASSALGADMSVRALPYSISIDPNVSCGTICENGHEGSYASFDEQLKRQFNELRDVYNDRVPVQVKKAVSAHFGVTVRDRIAEDEDLTEIETDLASIFSGYLSQEEFIMLQSIRNAIKGTDIYKRAVQKTGKEIEIFFTRPETGTELYWHGTDYAAGHFNKAGTRVHVSLPLAIRDAHQMVLSRNRGFEVPYSVVSVAVAQHEFNHIAENNHDGTLDTVIKAISERDIIRGRINNPKVTSFDLPDGSRYEMAAVSQYNAPIEDMDSLHQITQDGGWHSVAVSIDNLPKDLLELLEATKIDDDENVSMLDALKMSTDEIVFAPHLCMYNRMGEKMMYSVGEMVLDPYELYDRSVRPGKRVFLVGTLIPSDALRTGEMIHTRDIVEISHYIARAIGRRVTQQLVQDGKLGAEYLTNGNLFDRNTWAMERQFLLAFAKVMTQNSPEHGALIGRIAKGYSIDDIVKLNLLGQFLTEADMMIRNNNNALGISGDYMDIPPEVVSNIATVKESPRPTTTGIQEAQNSGRSGGGGATTAYSSVDVPKDADDSLIGIEQYIETSLPMIEELVEGKASIELHVGLRSDAEDYVDGIRRDGFNVDEIPNTDIWGSLYRAERDGRIVYILGGIAGRSRFTEFHGMLKYKGVPEKNVKIIDRETDYKAVYDRAFTGKDTRFDQCVIFSNQKRLTEAMSRVDPDVSVEPVEADGLTYSIVTEKSGRRILTIDLRDAYGDQAEKVADYVIGTLGVKNVLFAGLCGGVGAGLDLNDIISYSGILDEDGFTADMPENAVDMKRLGEAFSEYLGAERRVSSAIGANAAALVLEKRSDLALWREKNAGFVEMELLHIAKVLRSHPDVKFEAILRVSDLPGGRRGVNGVIGADVPGEVSAERNRWRESVARYILSEQTGEGLQTIDDRKAATEETLNTDYMGRSDDVIVIVGVPASLDMDNAASKTVPIINRCNAESGLGPRENNKQVITYKIDGDNTAENIANAVKRAREASPEGRLVLFAPEMERGPKLSDDARDLYPGVSIISDAYTDSDEGKGAYPDIMARVAIARGVAFCLSHGDNVEALNNIKNFLARITDSEALSGAGDINELLKKLNEMTLKIRPVDYSSDIKNWRASQEAIATSL